MRNLIGICVLAIAGAMLLLNESQVTATPMPKDLDNQMTLVSVVEPQVTRLDTMDYESRVAPWLISPPVELVAAQSAAIQGWEDDTEATNERIAELEEKIAELSKVKTSSAGLELQFNELEDRLSKLESSVTDVQNDHAALAKRVDELFALIEVRCPDGKVKTSKVSLNESGSGGIVLAPGERLLTIDGVPVASNTFSGGSNGTTVASTMTSTNYGSVPVAGPSGGSNGNVNYTAQAVNYQTSTYSVQSTSVGQSTNVQVQRRPLQSVRSALSPRARANAKCVGPNCPN